MKYVTDPISSLQCVEGVTGNKPVPKQKEKSSVVVISPEILEN